MAVQARLYDKILILHRGQAEGLVAAELELDLTDCLALLEQAVGKATAWIVVLDGTVTAGTETAIAGALRTFGVPAAELAKKAKAKLLLVSEHLPGAAAPTLTDALDALDTADSHRVLDVFAREHDFGNLKAELERAEARLAELLGVAVTETVAAMERFRDQANRVRHLHSTLSREILTLQKQKGAKTSAGGATPEALDRVAELKRAALAMLKTNGVWG